MLNVFPFFHQKYVEIYIDIGEYSCSLRIPRQGGGYFLNFGGGVRITIAKTVTMLTLSIFCACVLQIIGRSFGRQFLVVLHVDIDLNVHSKLSCVLNR